MHICCRPNQFNQRVTLTISKIKEYYPDFFAKYAPHSELRGQINGDLNDFFTMCFFLSNPEWAPKTLVEFVIDPHVYDFVIIMVIFMYF